MIVRPIVSLLDKFSLRPNVMGYSTWVDTLINRWDDFHPFRSCFTSVEICCWLVWRKSW